MISTSGEHHINTNLSRKLSHILQLAFSKNSAFSTILSEEEDNDSSETGTMFDDQAKEEQICSNMVQNPFTFDFGSWLLSQYCLWDINNSMLDSHKVEKCTSEFAPNNKLFETNFSSSGLIMPTPIKTKPTIDRTLKRWRKTNSSAETQPDLWDQLIDEKSVNMYSDMGENEEDIEKNSYVKAVFHITRIDRKTKRKTKINKHRHVISHCEHVGAQYYARGMCKKCYFSKGMRKKKAYDCEHKERSHYAKGVWKLCYLKNYHKTHDRKNSSRL